MASVIKIKRSSTKDAVPGSLQVGEIAVNLHDRKLYVGNTTGVTAIGGEDFRLTTKDSGSEGAYLRLLGDSVLSTNNVLLSAGEGIDISRLANGTITFAGEDASTSNKGIASFNSTRFSVSSGAVDVATGGINTTQLADSGVTTAKLADDAVTNAKIADNAVTLGTQTTGNYVATIADSGSSHITVSGSGSETAAVTLSITAGAVGTTELADGGVTTAKLGADAVTGAKIADDAIDSEHYVDGSIDTAHIADAAITAAKIAPNGLTANTYGAKSVGTAAIADGAITSAKIAGGAITANTLANDAVTLGTHTTGNYVATISGTANEIEVSGSGSETAAVTIGLPDDVTVTGQLNVGENVVVTGNTSVGGNLSVSGNLNVTGALTYLSTSTVYTDDGMMKLSANNAGDVTDTGIYAKYIESATTKYAGYFRDADDGVFKFYKGNQAEPSTTVDTAGTGYTLAQVDAVIDGGTY